MAQDHTPAGGARRGGLLGSLARLLDSLLEVVQTRIELLASEYEEEREHVRELLLYGMVTLAFFVFGVLLLTLFVILLLWERHGLLVVGLFAAAYLLAGFVALLVLRLKSRARPRLFATTLDELRRDRAGLRGPE